MTKLVLILSLGLLLFAGVAAADYDDCVAQSERIYNDCISRAEKHVNDIEVQDAKEACGRESGNSRAVCDDAEVRRNTGEPAPDADNGK